MDNSQNRRHFLFSTLSAAIYATPLAGLMPPAGLGASSHSVRRSATDPANQGNIELYRKAVEKMKATTFPVPVNGETMSWWEAHANIHNDSCPHGNWFFLPWHRGYLHYFEKVCRAFCGDPSFALPYWDWSDDSALPEAFTSGDEKSNALFNDTRSIKNRMALGVKEVTHDFVNAIMDISDFATFAGGASDRPRMIDRSIPNEVRGFSGRLEGGPHNRVHATIEGDMGAFISPRDPIFWLHHCNVDRLWSVWVSQRTAKDQDVLPSDPAADAKDVRLNRDYWLKAKIGGYYDITQDGEVFKAVPAEFMINDVVDASKMGLSYEWIAKVVPVPAPVQDAAAVPVVQDVPTGTVVTTPVPEAKNHLEEAKDKAKESLTNTKTGVDGGKAKTKTSFRNVVTRVESLKSKFGKKSGAMGNSAATLTIASTEALTTIMKDVGESNEAGDKTLQVVLYNIPFPSNKKAELQVYLNSLAENPSINDPEYVGNFAFFGHAHAGAVADMAFDLAPTIKRLIAAGKAPYGSGKPLIVSLVWRANPANDDLSAVSITFAKSEPV